MTMFNEREHAMMWGIYGELEMLNVHLARLTEILEHQEQERQDAETPKPIEPGPHARIMAERRLLGHCLLCGATRQSPGEGCYKWSPVNPYVEVWAPHSWPEDAPQG